MNTTMVMNGIAGVSPRFKARVAGLFWGLTILAGAFALFVGNRIEGGLIATACYACATVLVYDILKPVSKSLSSLAAVFSLAGCALGALGALQLVRSSINPLVFFGLHCLLVGILIFRSGFLPRILGVLMVFGGLGWLTFAGPMIADVLRPYIALPGFIGESVHLLRPYNLLPGILGESSLTLWLLVVGLNEQRWRERADRADRAAR